MYSHSGVEFVPHTGMWRELSFFLATTFAAGPFFSLVDLLLALFPHFKNEGYAINFLKNREVNCLSYCNIQAFYTGCVKSASDCLMRLIPVLWVSWQVMVYGSKSCFIYGSKSYNPCQP